MRVARSCSAEDVIVELERLIDVHGAPSFLRADNGPELIANTLHDWCRFSRIGISYIEPGSPWESPYVESFNGRVRDELLNIEEFDSLLEAQVVVEAWRLEYNTYRPHSALGGLTPAEVRAAWTTEHQPALMTGGPPNGVPSQRRRVCLRRWRQQVEIRATASAPRDRVRSLQFEVLLLASSAPRPQSLSPPSAPPHIPQLGARLNAGSRPCVRPAILGRPRTLVISGQWA